MGVSGDFDVLDEQIARLRALPTLPEKCAQLVARAVDTELRRTIAAGETPDGVPWQKTIEGKTPLRNAAHSLRVRAEGTTIVITLDGVEARHHYGAVRGHVRREIIPTGDLPIAMARTIDRIVTEQWRFVMGATA